MGGTVMQEKRSSARVKANLEMAAAGVRGVLLDLSETGARFSCAKEISEPRISLEIFFSDKKPAFNEPARLVWKEGSAGTGGFLHGVEFASPDEALRRALRGRLIALQISGLLDKVSGPEEKNRVAAFFLEDVFNYLNGISVIFPQSRLPQPYSPELEKKLEHLNNQILLKGYCLDLLISDREIMREAKENFRHLLGSWLYKSVILKHAFDKLQGFPFDFKIAEMFYENLPLSDGIGRYFDCNFLKSPYAVAARTRKSRVRDLLKKHIGENSLGRFNVLNLGCGSCREIRELLPDLKVKGRVVFTCLDFNKEALAFSQNHLLAQAGKNVEFKFFPENVPHLLDCGRALEAYGRQNLIYSVGLIDHLPDRILKKLVETCFSLLDSGGKLILTHENREKTFAQIAPHWFCDWKFYGRNKEELTDLFYHCGLKKFSLAAESDTFGYLFYYTLVKL